MKKIAFFAFLSCFSVVSCDKVFLNVEGKDADLQGKWQMDNADTVYYNFQKNLFLYQIYQKKDTIIEAYGYYTLHGDTAIDLELLKSLSPISLDYLNWDTLNSASGEKVFSKSFKIKALNSKKLILSSDGETLSFHKF
jgi:hypothetical protein